MKINDGTGSGKEAKVDSTNRLLVEAVTESEQLEAAAIGNAFQIGSGPITLTNANESAVLFYKNNEDKDIIITAVNVTSSKQTGSSAGVFLAKVIAGGTALSAGASVTALNNNFGSNKSLLATITAGQTSATVTDGTAVASFYIQEAVFFNTDIAWIIPKGVSVAISITPGASNTSVTVTTTLEAHIARDAL
jgi:hypothetical protein